MNGTPKWSKSLIKFFLEYVAMLAVFISMSVVAYCVPEDCVKDQVYESRQQLKNEGEYPGPHYFVMKDNVTDDLMLNMAATGIGEDDKPFEGFLMNYLSVDLDEKEQKSWTGKVSGGSPVVDYARYWHGYLLPLRMQLVITDLEGIRLVNIIVMSLLLLAACLLVYRRMSLVIACVFMFSVLAVSIPLVPVCMQFSTCFYIMLVSVISILLFPQLTCRKINMSLTMFAIGGITSYMDLLTVPVITLGYPLAIAALMHDKEVSFKSILVSAFAWLAGYGGIWAAKWCLSTFFTGVDVVEDAFVQISFRTFDTRYPLASQMIPMLLKYDYAGLAITFVASLCCWVFRKSIVLLRHYLYLVVIGCFPLIWYAVLQNHSLIHFWFTWRSLSLTFFCWGVYCMSVIDFSALRKVLLKGFKAVIGWKEKA